MGHRRKRPEVISKDISHFYVVREVGRVCQGQAEVETLISMT